MTPPLLTRRALLTGLAAFGATALLPPTRARASAPLALHVLKDPACGCCAAWIEILEAEGFEVTVEEASAAALARHKAQAGIPPDMASCHTGRIGGYTIEGHVPAADIRRLLAERPDAVGLAVPGMPYGSPGMGPESRREAYRVHLVRRDGSSRVFSRYDAA